MTSYRETLERIRTKFAELRSRDSRRSVFGARSHQYARNQALPEDAVAEFERTHGIELPEDYRHYITEVADGGGGPAYGVHRLLAALHNPWLTLGPLASPFSVDEGESNYEGCLLISQRGCGGWTFLVVSGPKRGEIWYDDTVADRGFTRADDGFLTWYEKWLTRSLEESSGQPKDEAAELVDQLMSLSESAPERLPAVLEREPDEEWLVAPLINVAMSCMQTNRPAAALPIYQRLFRLPTPEKGRVRRAYLEALNNGCIAACMVQDFESAAAIADQAQPFVEENPYIAHSAACAYVGVGDHGKALEQCRLAVRLGYEHLDQLEADQDLAPLHDNPEFQALFGKS